MIEKFSKAHKAYLKTCNLGYGARNLILKELGYRTYEEYLGSSEWRQIKKRVFAQKGKVCVGCDDEATAVHHEKYTKEVLEGKNLKWLHPVCDRCHTKVEFYEGRKLTLKESQRAFAILRERKEHGC